MRNFEKEHEASPVSTAAAKASPSSPPISAVDESNSDGFKQKMILGVVLVAAVILFLIVLQSGSEGNRSNKRALLLVIDGLSSDEISAAMLTNKLSAMSATAAHGTLCQEMSNEDGTTAASSKKGQVCAAAAAAGTISAVDSLATQLTGVSPAEHGYSDSAANRKTALNPVHPSALRFLRERGLSTAVVGTWPFVSNGKACGFVDDECTSVATQRSEQKEAGQTTQGGTEGAIQACFAPKDTDGTPFRRDSCNVELESYYDAQTDPRHILNGTATVLETADLAVVYLNHATAAAEAAREASGSEAAASLRRSAALTRIDGMFQEILKLVVRRSYFYGENWLFMTLTTAAKADTYFGAVVVNHGEVRSLEDKNGNLRFIREGVKAVDVTPTTVRWFNVSQPVGEDPTLKGTQGTALDL